MTYRSDLYDEQSAYEEIDDDLYEDEEGTGAAGSGLLAGNTLPITLIGLGVGWLLLNGIQGGSGGTGGSQAARSPRRGTAWSDVRDDDGMEDNWDDYQSYGDYYGAEEPWNSPGTRGMRQGGGTAGGTSGGSMGGLGQRARSAFSRFRHSVQDGADRLRHRAESHRSEGHRAGDWRRGDDAERPDTADQTARGYDSIADYDSREDGFGTFGGSRFAGTSGEAGGFTRGTGRRMRTANRSFWDMVDQHPMAAGLAGLALGAALGATLPPTETEDEWFGEFRDQTVDQAWAQGRDTVSEAGEVAREAARAGADAAMDTAGTRAREHGLT
ncbi:MAG: hypothetical protein RLY86_568 [Pseudomonadota bacterium]|jgi:hypothetical protein